MRKARWPAGSCKSYKHVTGGIFPRRPLRRRSGCWIPISCPISHRRRIRRLNNDLFMSKLKRYTFQIAALVVLFAAVYAGYVYWQAASNRPLNERYTIEEVNAGDVTQTVTANGTLNP